MAAITRMRIQRWLLVALLLLAGGVVAWDVLRTTEEVEEAADRYERVNARIEGAMPKGEGIAPTAQSWSAPADLTIVITTRAARDGEAAQVEIRVEEDGPWTLPLPPLLVLRRPHQKRPRRDQHELHSQVVLKRHRHAVLLRLRDLLRRDVGPGRDLDFRGLVGAARGEEEGEGERPERSPAAHPHHLVTGMRTVSPC